MATPKSQRIGIWIIAIVLAIGTMGSFLAMILGTQNQATDQANIKKMEAEYQTKTAAQTKQLSDKYYPEFSQYGTAPAVFNADDIKEVTKTDIKVGDGEEIKSSTAQKTDSPENQPDSTYSAYYIGWNPKGVIFDQSIADGALKAPIAGGGLIPGWEEGVKGMKIGGIREISIPSEKAYGSTGSGENIPPNTPLKFIVMAIPKVNEITMPPELLQYYQTQYSGQQ